LLFDDAGLQVVGQVRKAQLRQPGGAPLLPGDRLHPPAPLAGGQLPRGPPPARDPGLLHQPPDRPPVRGDLDQQPLPLKEPVLQNPP
jgi:hypothetical protein